MQPNTPKALAQQLYQSLLAGSVIYQKIYKEHVAVDGPISSTETAKLAKLKPLLSAELTRMQAGLQTLRQLAPSQEEQAITALSALISDETDAAVVTAEELFANGSYKPLARWMAAAEFCSESGRIPQRQLAWKTGCRKAMECLIGERAEGLRDWRGRAHLNGRFELENATKDPVRVGLLGAVLELNSATVRSDLRNGRLLVTPKEETVALHLLEKIVGKGARIGDDVLPATPAIKSMRAAPQTPAELADALAAAIRDGCHVMGYLTKTPLYNSDKAIFTDQSANSFHQMGELLGLSIDTMMPLLNYLYTQPPETRQQVYDQVVSVMGNAPILHTTCDELLADGNVQALYSWQYLASYCALAKAGNNVAVTHLNALPAMLDDICERARSEHQFYPHFVKIGRDEGRYTLRLHGVNPVLGSLIYNVLHANEAKVTNAGSFLYVDVAPESPLVPVLEQLVTNASEHLVQHMSAPQRLN